MGMQQRPQLIPWESRSWAVLSGLSWNEARSLFFTDISHPPLPVTNYRLETAPGARTWHWIRQHVSAKGNAWSWNQLWAVNSQRSQQPGKPHHSPAGEVWTAQLAIFTTAAMRRQAGRKGGRLVSFIKMTEFSYFKKVDHQRCWGTLTKKDSSHPTSPYPQQIQVFQLDILTEKNEPHSLPQTIHKKIIYNPIMKTS